MKKLTTTILINAEPYEVWHSFTQFHAWQLWNPFLSDVRGTVRLNERLTVTIFPNTPEIFADMAEFAEAEETLAKQMSKEPPVSLNKSSTYNVKVSRYEENSYLQWKYSSFFMGKYQHDFAFNTYEDGNTAFENTVQMSGLLVNLGWENFIKHYYQSGLERMNFALKQVVESTELFIDGELVDYRK